MAKITLILGGARSGKSTYALKLAAEKNVAFIATCQGLDKEMRERIRFHKMSRPKHWQTNEEPYALPEAISRISNKFDCLIIDCLTLWVSNLILKKKSLRYIEGEIIKTIKLLKKSKAKAIIVSNEVGLGIIPVNKLSRNFRDIAGKVNQIVAGGSDEVVFMVSGIPWRIK
jgi:adenosylcobinamide kinase/adenosylcobinamide-phosphate guanylyltransferase